jgi:putative ABC transport system ATP-binding protein
MEERGYISCRGIKKGYGSRENRIEALKGIDLDVYPGHLTLLVGPSGSGKSTLLSIITTILTPDEGQLYLMGRETSKMREREKALFCRKNLGIVFQSLFLIPTLTVLENVSLPLIVEGMSSQQAEKKAVEFLDRVHLAHRRHDTPTVLSKGQQQKVAIARAMVNDSNILVCDEPTSSLDQTAGREVMTLISDLATHASRTVLVVTHDHRIFHFADRILTMNDGLISEGTKDE